MRGPNTGNFVCYFRVSTQRQGRSGLGLEAQQQAVRDHLNGGNWRIVAEFVEVESGKRKDRPKLAEALAACRVHGAKLIIAKLDRLARNVAFVSNLMESGVDFEAVDFPQANRLTIHILAAVAEHEARMISERTKAALAAASCRGVKLGGDRGARLTAKARQAGVAARQNRANARAADLAPTIKALRAAGVASFRGVADELNQRGIPPASGRGEWQAVQVIRVLERDPEMIASVKSMLGDGKPLRDIAAELQMPVSSVATMGGHGMSRYKRAWQAV
jgi:DNA invertase Pin-like site-specific DNA recombinase